MPVSRTEKWSSHCSGWRRKSVSCSWPNGMLARRAPGGGDFDDHFALVGELHGVADEIDQDLPQPGHVADQDLGNGIVHQVGEVEVLLGGLGRQQIHGLLDAGVEFEGMVFQLQLAGFDLGEVQDVIDDGQQRVGAAAGGLDIIALLVRQFGVQQQGGHADDAVHGRADFVAHVGQELGLGERGFLELLVERNEGGVAFDELLLAFAQRPVGGIALQQVQVGLRVIANPGDQLDLVGQLHQVIIGAEGKGLAFDLGVLVRGEDDDGGVFGGRVGAELLDQREAVHAGHHQVLENHRGLDLVGDGEGLAGVGAVMEINVGLVGQGAADGFADHGLVVHQQDHDVVIRPDAAGAPGPGSRCGWCVRQPCGFIFCATIFVSRGPILSSAKISRGGAQLRRGAGHAVNRAAGPVLGDGMMALRVQSAQSFGSVPAHAGEQDADHVSRPESFRALEEEVNGRTVGAIRRVPRIDKPGRTRKHEMIILAGQQDGAGLRAVAFAGQAHVERGLAIQPVGQAWRRSANPHAER